MRRLNNLSIILIHVMFGRYHALIKFEEEGSETKWKRKHKKVNLKFFQSKKKTNKTLEMIKEWKKQQNKWIRRRTLRFFHFFLFWYIFAFFALLLSIPFHTRIVYMKAAQKIKIKITLMKVKCLNKKLTTKKTTWGNYRKETAIEWVIIRMLSKWLVVVIVWELIQNWNNIFYFCIYLVVPFYFQ